MFARQWSMLTAGMLLGAVNVFLFAYAKPWSASDGVRNWGEWFFNVTGVNEKIIVTPLLYTTSMLNIGIVLGALAAALLASQFQLRMAPWRELVKGLLGGVLMGIGSTLAFGCNIGGFFSATSALSLAGPVMMIGLLVGAYIGVRLLSWEVEFLPPPTWGIRRRPSSGSPRRLPPQPVLGAGLLLAAMAGVLVYDRLEFTDTAVFLLFGLFIGIVMQRSRFCFVRAFREPFLTGNADATRAAAVAVMISLTGFTILKWADLRDWEEVVHPAVWLGSLLGGTLFGIGMCIAGGCATGSLWRAGEGHVKLWVALSGFALTAAYSRAWLEDSGDLMKLGVAVFLPDVMTWKAAYLMLIGIMLLWVLIAAWNEKSQKLVMN